MENILLSLQKLHPYNKNLRRHQTKNINIAINTNESKLLKNWNFTQTCSLLKRINWKLYIKLSLFRSSPPKVLSKEDAPQTWSKTHRRSKMQRRNLNKAALQIYLNHTPTNPEKLTAYLWNTLQMGNTPGRLLLHVKIIKDLINKL